MLAPQLEQTVLVVVPFQVVAAAKLDLVPMPESVEPAVSIAKAAKAAAVEMAEGAATVEQVATVAGGRVVGPADLAE